MEVSSSCPIDYDELTDATDLITNFGQYWQCCPKSEQQALYGDFGVILGINEIASYLVAEAISEKLSTSGATGFAPTVDTKFSFNRRITLLLFAA